MRRRRETPMPEIEPMDGEAGGYGRKRVIAAACKLPRFSSWYNGGVEIDLQM
jgi:hypothetical protein